MPETGKPADGDAGNGTDGAGEGTQDGGTTGAAGSGSQSQGEPKKVELTQEELDRIIADRVRRAQPKDYDDLKAKATKYDEAEAAKLSEADKAKQAQTAAEAAAAERTAKADTKLKRAAIIAEATAQKAADPDIIVALLAGSEDITVTDDGEVEGVKDAIKALLKSKPILGPAQAGNRSGGEFGGNDQKTLKERIEELERAGKYAEARDLKVTMMSAPQS